MYDQELIEAIMDRENFETEEEATEYLDDHYQGEHLSLVHWAENFLEESGSLEGMPENLVRYFDFDYYARDAELGGDIFTIESAGGIYVLWNH